MLNCLKLKSKNGFAPSNPTRSVRSNLTGFTLIETMVAFFIFSMVFIALAYSFPRGLMINKTAESSTKASYLAQSQLEYLNSLGYSNVAAGTIEAKHRLSADPTSYLYFFQRQTEAQYVDSNLQNSLTDTGLKKITVTVYYTNSFAKAEKTYITTTLINQW